MANGAKSVAVNAAVIGGLLGLAAILVIGTRDEVGNVIDGQPNADGTATCVGRFFNCTAYTPASSEFAPDGGPPYVNLVVTGEECLGSDGGSYFIIPPPSAELIFEPMLCIPKAGTAPLFPNNTEARSATGTEPGRCACRGFKQDAGMVGRCFVPLPDGGPSAEPIPYGETIFPGRFAGRDCFRKECGEVAGISSWPFTVCPTGINPDGGPREVGP